MLTASTLPEKLAIVREGTRLQRLANFRGPAWEGIHNTDQVNIFQAGVHPGVMLSQGSNSHYSHANLIHKYSLAAGSSAMKEASVGSN